MGCDCLVNYQRQTVGQTPTGAQVNSWATVLTNLRASIQPASDRVIADYMQRQIRIDTTVFIDADLAKLLSPGPALGDRILYAGQYYIVMAPKRWQNFAISPTPYYEVHSLLGIV
jgi:hypothetical protein